MKKFKVTFYPDNCRVEVGEGETLLQAAMTADVHIDSHCGGEGTCGRCRVIVDDGVVEKISTSKLTDEELDKGYVQACLSKVKSDVKVLVPPESRLGSVPEEHDEVILYGRTLSAAEEAERLATISLDPPVKKTYLRLDPPTLDDNTSDASRLIRELRKKGVEGGITIDFNVLNGLAKGLRQTDWSVTTTNLDDAGHTTVLRLEEGDTTKKQYSLAIDVGTTTVVAKLVDLSSKQTIAETSRYNGQISCGEDVISRIAFAGKGRGLERLKGLVIDTINSLILRLANETGIEPDEISHVTAAGNTIMLHLLLGLDPKYLREDPYIPTATSFSPIRAVDLGFALSSSVILFVLPCVASYLGADIVAGTVASDMVQSDELSLYIDIGTNGEIVLGNKDFLISCSCSAGPAFEGGGVKYGMRATAGAIEEVAIDQDTFEPMIMTIGRKKPIGICGSALVDVLAELFLSGLINQKGKISTDIDTPRIIKGETGTEYVLVWAKDSGIESDIVITEADIDNLLRAKAAVFAAVDVLLDSVSTSLDNVHKILIAGAFGKHLDARKAMTIGLLPELASEKFFFIGNGSLWGAHFAALSSEFLKDVHETAKRMTYLDLSINNKFMDGYVSALFLPHTDMTLFPGVAERLAKGSSTKKVISNNLDS